ncbi:paraquat-inducible protein A [Marinobacterium jannaschii]|uniref:paraquat-inducible protein A n=1 Tax=Marinobacterium jannaschii TaxID=64970 RepID=UPI0009FBE109|nr:paraquat-inducible protein A [Marinobacterium jannaschii]
MAEESSASTAGRGIPAGQARRLKGVLVAAFLLFIAGISLPMITISKFYIVENSFSVLSGILELLLEGQLVLFILIGSFSVVLPVLKLAVLYRLLSATTPAGKLKRYLHLMHEYGRWSMLDVMVVAVLTVTVKLGAIASVEVHYGLYLFGASVLLMMLITQRITALVAGKKP